METLSNELKGICSLMPETAFEKLETFHFLMSREVLKHKSEHFERTDVHFDVDGLCETYKCSIDGCLYDVKIAVRRS